jgi:hypothetical protein
MTHKDPYCNNTRTPSQLHIFEVPNTPRLAHLLGNVCRVEFSNLLPEYSIPSANKYWHAGIKFSDRLGRRRSRQLTVEEKEDWGWPLQQVVRRETYGDNANPSFGVEWSGGSFRVWRRRGMLERFQSFVAGGTKSHKVDE